MIHLTSQNIKINRPTAVAIGKFDGVHRGHMALLTKLKEVAQAQSLATLVLTFSPHPIAYFKKSPMPLLLDPKEKLELFDSIGFDYYLEYAFDEKFAQTEPEDFLKNVLFEQLQGRALVVAEGYRFGKNGRGTVELAKEVCEGLGIGFSSIGQVVHDGHKISSDNLRKMIEECDFELFSKLCGRDFSISATVTHCNALGRTIGFPTANMLPHPEKLLPPNGVYASMVSLDGNLYKSITSIGFKPTIADKDELSVETHIFDFDDSLYGKEITVVFKHKLRNEQKFASMDELSAQLKKDVEIAKSRLI